MTNERAIELLRRISDSQFDGVHGDERREALEMAVRALEGDGDTISRKMAIDAFKKWFWESLFIYPSMSLDEIEKFELLLYRFPTEQKERKKGRWIKEYWHSDKVRECSVCHVTQSVTTYRDKVNFNFCPYCGADMRRENDA